MVAEVRNGIQTIDHIAIPVRDLQRNQDFYVNVISFSSKVHVVNEPIFDIELLNF